VSVWARTLALVVQEAVPGADSNGAVPADVENALARLREEGVGTPVLRYYLWHTWNIYEEYLTLCFPIGRGLRGVAAPRCRPNPSTRVERVP